MAANDLTLDEYEELSLKKKTGEATAEENLHFENKCWQNLFDGRDTIINPQKSHTRPEPVS